MPWILLAFSGAFFYRAFPNPVRHWPLVWTSLSFLLAASAYAGLGPALFGKRRNGRLHPISLLLMLPYILGLYLLHVLQVILSSEPPAHRITPTFYLGRRVAAREMPQDVTCIVDLTCELPEFPGTIGQRRYIALPTLDYRGPAPRTLADAVRELARLPGVLYLHCAQGHGRSATLAAALLVYQGLAPDAESALALLREKRPRIFLTPHQRRALAATLRLLAQEERLTCPRGQFPGPA